MGIKREKEIQKEREREKERQKYQYRETDREIERNRVMNKGEIEKDNFISPLNADLSPIKSGKLFRRFKTFNNKTHRNILT